MKKILSKQSNFWLSKSHLYSKKKSNSFFKWKIFYGCPFFKKILKKTNPKTIMEIGTNIGINLHYIRKIDYQKKIKIDAIEVNKKICDQLKKNKKLKINCVINEDILNYSGNKKYDLVFTKGLLIHIDPKNLNKVINKIIKMSKKYILIIEYFSHKPTSIKNYRGKKDLLFKRDFGKLFLKKNLKCIDYGFLWKEKELVFDNLNWWIFKKT